MEYYLLLFTLVEIDQDITDKMGCTNKWYLHWLSINRNNFCAKSCQFLNKDSANYASTTSDQGPLILPHGLSPPQCGSRPAHQLAQTNRKHIFLCDMDSSLSLYSLAYQVMPGCHE